MENVTPSSEVPPTDSRRSLRDRLGLSITALAAGLVNLVGGTAVLKAWIFNVGQTYYDALLAAFDLPQGIIILPDAMVTATGYEVFRENTETWLQLAIFGIPLMFLAALAFIALEWLLQNTLGRLSPRTYSGINMFGDKFAKAYIVMALLLSPALLFGVFWLGIYKYPTVAEAAGRQRHAELVNLTGEACARCPMWNNAILGVAIVSDGKTALIATGNGVRSISVNNIEQVSHKVVKRN